MWAAVNTSHAHIATAHIDRPGAIPLGNPNLDTEKSDYDSCGKTSLLVTDSTLVDDESAKGAIGRRGWSGTKSSSSKEGDNDHEMGRLTEDRGLGSVVIDRTYTVTSD